MPTPWEQGFVEVADRCYLARYREWDVNVGVVVGSAGALVVDTRGSLAQGFVAYGDIGLLPGRPVVRWVVNSHAHFDHVLGNGAFPDAVVWSHENTLAGIPEAVAEFKRSIVDDNERSGKHPEISEQVLQEVLDTEPRLPDRTVSSATAIDLGDRFVELVHPGRGHTDGDLVLRVPDCDVLFAGDLVEESADREATPSFGSDCWPLEWAATLDLVIGLIDEHTVVVPGHGAVVDRAFVDRQRDDVSAVAELIRQLAASGVPVERAVAEGERVARPATLAATAGRVGEREPNESTGWPFPVRFLGDAVERGYQHLGVHGG